MKPKDKKPVKLHVRRGDTVIVIAGDERGKSGKIVSVDRIKERAIVEGLNMVKKSVKPSAEFPQGGFSRFEASIHVSNLMLIDPSNGKPTKVSRIFDENGKKQRVSKRTGAIIKTEF